MDIDKMDSSSDTGVIIDTDLPTVLNQTVRAILLAQTGNNNTHNDINDDSHLQIKKNLEICHTYDFVIEVILMGFFCLFGFCGNTLSMICLSRDKSKTATPFLLVSLEAADTFFLFTVLVLRVLNTISTYFQLEELDPIWPYVGKYIYPFALIAETGTIYLTLLVTVNRYVSVCKPYDASSLCSVPHARTHVIMIIVFSIVYNIPRFFEYIIAIAKDPRTVNGTVWAPLPSDLVANEYYQIIYLNIMYFLVMFLIPLITLIFLNSNLILALRETKRKRAQLLSSSESHNRSEDDITLILIVVVLVFIVCQTPALVTQVLNNVLDDKSKLCSTVYFYYERISDLLVVGNSSLNFIIYCFCSKKFRQILKSLICKEQADSPVQPRRNVQSQVKEQPKNNQLYTPVPLSAPTENGTTFTHVNKNGEDDSKV